MADIGTLTPDQMLEQQKILRQQKMAEMLMQQGMQQPQSQMVGGRYVAPSLTQNLAQLANVYMGQRGIERAEQAQLNLAKAIRQGEIESLADFEKIRRGTPAVEGGIYGPDNKLTMQTTPDMIGPQGELTSQYRKVAPVAGVAPNPQAAYANLYANPKATQRQRDLAFAKMTADPESFTLTEGGVRFERMPDGSIREIAAGPAKVRAPIQVDTGTHIELRDAIDPNKVLQRIPKAQMPQAGQVVETAQGPMIVNTRTGEAAPIVAGGQPLPPKMSTEQSKDITAINQQRSVVDSALTLVKATPTAFNFGRGVAGAIPFGESIAGRTEKPAETEARAAVFNIVSKVINERAGAAQSNQEIKRLNSFLPSEYDNAKQIENKLNGFKKFLDEQEKGTRMPTSVPSTPTASAQPKVFSSQADLDKAIAEKRVQKNDKVTVNGVTGTIQ
jgi:hypothetical protein